MKTIRHVMLVLALIVLTSFSIYAQEDETITHTMPDGSVITLPAGWQIATESDDFGNLSVIRPDEVFSAISLPPLDDIAPALEQLGVDEGNVLEGLLEALVSDIGSSLDDGETEQATYGDVETIRFTAQTDDGIGVLLLGQYPTGHVILFRLQFADEVDTAIMDDVAFIIENTQPAQGSADSGEETNTITFDDGSVIIVPTQWDVVEVAEEINQAVMRLENGADVSLLLPDVESVHPLFEEFEIEAERITEALVQYVLAQYFLTMDEGNIELTTYGNADMAIFDFDSDATFFRIYAGEYPAGNVMLLITDFADIELFDEETITQFDNDVENIFATAQLAGDQSAEVDDDSEEAETSTNDEEEQTVGEDTRTTQTPMEMVSYGFLDERLFSVPADWEFDEKNEEIGFFRFVILPVDENAMQVDFQIDIPTEESLQEGSEELDVSFDELAMTVLEFQVDDSAIEFDPNVVETVEFDNGTILIYRVLDDDGFYATWYFASYDNERIALLSYIGYAEFGEQLDNIALDIIESVEFPE